MPYGIVTNTKAGYIKAEIPEMEYETDWIPVINLFANTNKSQFNIPLNTQVFIMNEYDMYGELKNQVCIGSTYNDEDTPPFSKTKDGVIYADGTEISYDVTSKTVTINSAFTIDVKAPAVNIGTQGIQSLVSLTTLYAYLQLVNTALSKIPAPPTGAEISALNAALTLVNTGVPSIKTPLT